MKLKLRYLFLSLLTVGFMASCDNDDDHYTPDTTVRLAFEKMFPDASKVKWESKLGYVKAEFRDNNKEKDAWFDTDGTWMLTETEVAVSDIPVAITQSIAGSRYADWKIEDADYLERKDMEPIYIIEVEKGKEEVDLYYAPEGKLLKAVAEGGSHQAVPTPVNEKVLEAVNAKYPFAKILEIDVEPNFIEVDLVRDNLYFEMILDKEYNWVETVYEAAWLRVPDAVKNAFEADGYTFNAEEDEVEMLMRPNGNQSDMIVYRFELDREPADIILYYTEDGTKLNG